jgi:Do/DeqQ family serine protease
MRARRLVLPLLILLASCSGQPGKAQPFRGDSGFGEPNRHAPADAASMRMSFAPIVKRAAPAVVNVFSKRIVRQQVDPFWQLFGAGVPQSRVAQSLGSGAIVRADGIVVTNNHVIEGGQEIMVVLSDRREFPAKVLLADARTDVAVLKIDAANLPVLPLDDDKDVEVGDLVLAIGNPFGVGQTVTNGIVSALARAQQGSDDSVYIQTDAPINPGNSGGPLVDMDGDMIGLNNSIYSRTGTSTGVGFAIPAPVVKQVIEAATGSGTRHALIRPWLGVNGQTVSGEIAQSLGLPRPEGVLISDVYPGSAAARAGVRSGDVILAVDGQPVNEAAELNYRFSTHRPGDQIRLDVRQGGQTRTLSARGEPAPATPAKDERVLKGRNPFGGATVINMSAAAAQDLGVDPFAARGVVVTQVGGYAASVGLRPGDVIKALNGRKIDTTAELQSALSGQASSWRITVNRRGQDITANFQL